MPRKNAPRSAAGLRRIAAFLCLAVFLTACIPSLSLSGTAAPQPTPTSTPLRTNTPAAVLPAPARLNESPALQVLVHAGKLEPVKSRLPEHPKVVRPVEKMGTYGGTWRMAIQPMADTAQFIRTVMYEPLVRWTSDWSGIEPNLVEDYQVNHNYTEFVFTLRKGLRWSDGEPFTTADIRFWYYDVLLNQQLTPTIPAWLMSNGEAAQFLFPDDLHFKVVFSYPNTLFLQQLATPDALAITAFPAHYVKQFHITYAEPFALRQLVEHYGYASWVELFQSRVGVNIQDIGNFADPDRPRLSAWILKDPYQRGASAINWYRNPYYWKVDPAGNQLPYIDSVFFSVVNSMDDAISRAMAGNIDMQNLSALGIDVAETFGNGRLDRYNLYRVKDSSNNVMTLNFNLAHPDPALRAVFQNKNFRIGLSYAINRKEIIDLVYHGVGQPWQSAPRADSVLYDPMMATQYTEYDVAKANEYLDKAGYRRDQMGDRLGPDGMPISFSIEVLESEPQQIAMLNMIARYWNEVGIDIQPKIDPLPIFLAAVHSNQHDAVAWRGGGTVFADVLLDPSSYLATNENAFWAIPWAHWYLRSSGSKQMRPDDTALTAIGIYDRLRAIPDINDQARLLKGALTVARESFWTIGIALGPEEYGIVRSNFHNVPTEMPSAWNYPDPGPACPEQFFFGS